MFQRTITFEAALCQMDLLKGLLDLIQTITANVEHYHFERKFVKDSVQTYSGDLPVIISLYRAKSDMRYSTR